MIAIIILNWNGWADTRECLNSLRELENIEFVTILVDNGSDNGIYEIKQYGLNNYAFVTNYTLQQINASSELPIPQTNSLVLIENNENLGFAKANNVGIRYAELTGFEYIYLLNNDTVSDPDSLNKLTKVLMNSDFSAVVPQIRYYNPNDIIWCCGGELNGFYEQYHYKNENIRVVPNKRLIPITFATGCALLFKRSEVGLLSEKFFFGEEDFELSLRMKKKGLKMACVLDSVIYHKESASIDKSAKHLNKIYVHKLNRLINVKDYAAGNWPLILIYRSFKFFMLMVLVEKRGFFKSLKYASRFCIQAFTLKQVNKKTFFEILNMPLS